MILIKIIPKEKIILKMILRNKPNRINLINNNAKIYPKSKNIRYNDYDKENNIENENIGDIDSDDCFLCGIKQSQNNYESFYLCRECDKLLCKKCKKKHDLINPQHNLVTSYISGEIDPNKIENENINDNNNINNKQIQNMNYRNNNYTMIY